MSKRKNGDPQTDADSDEDLRAIYAQYKKEFTAADLQKYTEIEEGIPAAQVIAKCEEILREAKLKQKGSQVIQGPKKRKKA